MKTYVLYHDCCADGFGAAYAAWCALGEGAIYLPVAYGKPFPDLEDGSRVFILDFSYPDNNAAREALQLLAKRMHELVVIDHHATAAKSLEGLPFARFDVSKSGAVLAWEYFRELEEPGICYGAVPELLLYVQDRDLWKWELPQSQAVNAALGQCPRLFSEWHSWNMMGNHGIAQLCRVGQTVLQTHAALVDALCKTAHVQSLRLPGQEDPETILAVNTAVLQSEVCHELLERHAHVQMVAAFFLRDRCTVVWSLRSRPGVDCSALARCMGGGGHPQAAGFQTCPEGRIG